MIIFILLSFWFEGKALVLDLDTNFPSSVKSLKLWLKSPPLSQIRRWNCQIDFSFESFKSVQSLLIYFALKRNNEFLRLLFDIQINQNFVLKILPGLNWRFISIYHIHLKGDGSRFTISQQKITFWVKFQISYFVWYPTNPVALITFDFSIKPESICLLEPQDKSKKFTNFESFLILGEVGGGKYAKTWSLPKANFQVGYIYYSTVNPDGHYHALYTIHHTPYTIQILHYTV